MSIAILKRKIPILIVAIAMLTGLAFVCGRTPRSWRDIRVGMTPEEVNRLVAEKGVMTPTSLVVFKDIFVGTWVLQIDFRDNAVSHVGTPLWRLRR